MSLSEHGSAAPKKVFTKRSEPMSGSELQAVAVHLYGEDWRARLGDFLKVDSVTLRRWVQGKNAVPEVVSSAVRLLLRVKRGY